MHPKRLTSLNFTISFINIDTAIKIDAKYPTYSISGIPFTNNTP